MFWNTIFQKISTHPWAQFFVPFDFMRHFLFLFFRIAVIRRRVVFGTIFKYYLNYLSEIPRSNHGFITPPSGRGLVIPIFFISVFFGNHLPQTSSFRSAK